MFMMYERDEGNAKGCTPWAKESEKKKAFWVGTLDWTFHEEFRMLQP